MSRKKKRRRTRRGKGPASDTAERPAESGPGAGETAQPDAGTAVTVTAPADFAAQRSAIHKLLARGHHREAVNQAKFVHKSLGSQESEELLVEAYRGRIRQMLDRGMLVESSALLGSVLERYPSARPALEETQWLLAARSGRLETLLKPLGEPELSRERRAAIEGVIRREVTDPAALAECPALAAGHPLRRAAAALVQALDKVTNGPVEDDAVALPEVSRRSPLAPWKLLVRAIAHFYAEDDEACGKCLESIEDGTVVARLKPALRAMLSDSVEPLKPAERTLIAQVQGRSAELRAALQLLDEAFEEEAETRVVAMVRRAVKLCGKFRSDLLDKLRQRTFVRFYVADIGLADVSSALGGSFPPNAHFWQLFARAIERERNVAMACALWDEFRQNAIREGWFAEDGAEVAALYLHLAGLLQRLSEKGLRHAQRDYAAEFTGLGFIYEIVRTGRPTRPGRAEGNRSTDFLYPERLYRRASRIDPDPEVFRLWLGYGQRESHWRPADEAALAWHEAVPDDVRPLLHLMESAEKRNAFQKALGYVEEAERIGGLNPEVRRARLRLWVSTAKRHLKDKKTHLAEKDFEAIAALPQVREGDRLAFLAALRWVGACIAQDDDGRDRWETEVAGLLESRLASVSILNGLGKACGLGPSGLSMPTLAKQEQGRVAAALARAAALCDDMGALLELPSSLGDRMVGELSSPDCKIDPLGLRMLAEAALRTYQYELAYAASALGLNRSDADPARFLLLRAQCVPFWDRSRRHQCISAAAELARRRRDMGLVGEAVELLRGSGRRSYGFAPWQDEEVREILEIRAEEVEEILRTEREQRAFEGAPPSLREQVGPLAPDPKPSFEQHTFWDDLAPDEAPDEEDDEDDDDDGPWDREDDEDDDFDDDGDDDEDDAASEVEEMFEDLPPEVAALMMELIAKHCRSGDIPDPREIAKLDPELYRRIDEAMRRSEGFEARDSGPRQAKPIQGSRRSRKRRGKRRKRRR